MLKCNSANKMKGAWIFPFFHSSFKTSIMESLETLIKRSKSVNYQSPPAMQFREPVCLCSVSPLRMLRVLPIFTKVYFKNAYIFAHFKENAYFSSSNNKEINGIHSVIIKFPIFHLKHFGFMLRIIISFDFYLFIFAMHWFKPAGVFEAWQCELFSGL